MLNTEKVQKVIANGPKSTQKAEAGWYIEQGGLEFSGPARKAFELGVALAGGTTRQAWVATDDYREARSQERGLVSYAIGTGAKPKETAKVVKTAKVGGPAAGEIREWAIANGHEVSARGRISWEVKAAYEAAMKEKRKAERAATKAAPTVGMSAAERRAARNKGKSLSRTTASTARPESKPKSRRSGRASRTELQPGESEF